MRVCASRRYVVAFGGAHPRSVEIKSSVRLHDEVDFICGKTGSSHDAGACLVFCAAIAGRQVVISQLASSVRFKGEVIAESDRRYDDANAVLNAVRALYGG